MLVRSRAPLRLGLAGGGTDVSPYSDEYGGCVLNATINLYAYCTLQVRPDGKLSFHAVDRDEHFESAAPDYFPLGGSLVLHKGVYNRIVRDYNGGKPLAISLTTYSDTPAGSGLGSSSTMVVAMLKAYVELLNLPLGEYDIAHLAYEIERVDAGLSGGKQDQYAATFGGFNFIEFNSDNNVIVNPLRIKNWIIDELEVSMVLYFTGTSRDSSRIIDEQRRNVIRKNDISINAMHELKADAVLMKEAILKGDIPSFGQLLGKSWEAKKKMAAGISNSKINQVYELAMESGAYAGKVSGAGGGGFMMFMVDPLRKTELLRTLRKLDGEVISFNFTKDGTHGWRI